MGGFYKDISDPIEFYETPASDTNRARESSTLNPPNSSVSSWRAPPFEFSRRTWRSFLQGNATLQDSETTAGERAMHRQTSVGRLLVPDYLVNLTIGFDSLEGNHTASLIYNVFGKRLYRAGRLGAPDEFEQPFHSLT